MPRVPPDLSSFEARKWLCENLPDKCRAMTVREIAADHFGVSDATSITRVRRWLNQIVGMGEAECHPPLHDDEPVALNGGPAARHAEHKFRRYWAARSPAQSLSEPIALQILVSSELFTGALKGIRDLDVERGQDLARRRLDRAGGLASVLRERLFIAHDGLGRQPAQVRTDVLAEVLRAMELRHQVMLDYGGHEERSQVTVSVRALAYKDGSLYLVGSEGSRPPRAYALQRVNRAERQARLAEAVVPKGYDKDAVRRKFECGHTVPVAAFPLQPLGDGKRRQRMDELLDAEEEPITLRLRVAPRALFHFRERRLTPEQRITTPSGEALPDDAEPAGLEDDPGTWPVVEATLPYTVLLLPFLLSMGPWLVVEAPSAVKDQMKLVTGLMAARYP